MQAFITRPTGYTRPMGAVSKELYTGRGLYTGSTCRGYAPQGAWRRTPLCRRCAGRAWEASDEGRHAVRNVISKAVPTAGAIPPQRQEQPGVETEMTPTPEYIKPDYQGSGKLCGKVALITGGDSGIGRAVAVHFAREGAKGITIVYKSESEDKDAQETVRLCAKEDGTRCLAVRADVGDPQAVQRVVSQTLQQFGHIDVLVNNAAEQHYHHTIEDISPEQLMSTFNTNVFGMYYMVQAALPHMKEGASIINTTSVTAYIGAPELLDYSATKGCILSFTRSLSQQLVDKGIRVNAVAPGPIWTPLIPATFPEESLPQWQSSTPMQRAGQPSEVGPCYVMLASEDGTYFSGQVLHPNGGTPVSS